MDKYYIEFEVYTPDNKLMSVDDAVVNCTKEELKDDKLLRWLASYCHLPEGYYVQLSEVWLIG